MNPFNRANDMPRKVFSDMSPDNKVPMNSPMQDMMAGESNEQGNRPPGGTSSTGTPVGDKTTVCMEGGRSSEYKSTYQTVLKK